jgi:hypothetical protein
LNNGNYIFFRYSTSQLPEIIDTVDDQNLDVKGYIETNYLHDSQDGERYLVYDRARNKVVGTFAVVVSRKLELVMA